MEMQPQVIKASNLLELVLESVDDIIFPEGDRFIVPSSNRFTVPLVNGKVSAGCLNDEGMGVAVFDDVGNKILSMAFNPAAKVFRFFISDTKLFELTWQENQDGTFSLFVFPYEEDGYLNSNFDKAQLQIVDLNSEFGMDISRFESLITSLYNRVVIAFTDSLVKNARFS